MNALKRIAMVGLLISSNLLLAPWATAQNAVTNWNNIAITAARASKAPGAASGSTTAIYIAYVELAVYNAVNAIDGRFEPYKYSLTAPAGASADAAAIEAAYQTLIRLFPDQKQYLDTQDRKSTRLNSSHSQISYAVFCLKKKKNKLETNM